MGDVLHVAVVEEHVVNDEAPKQFDWSYDENIISLTQWPPKTQSNCMHDNCPNCNGTGRSIYGGACVHGLVCPCDKCRIH